MVGDGALTKRARYIAQMAELLADRAEAYEGAVREHTYVRYGYELSQTESGTNVERMIVQLRAELLELGKILKGEQ